MRPLCAPGRGAAGLEKGQRSPDLAIFRLTYISP